MSGEPSTAPSDSPDSIQVFLSYTRDPDLNAAILLREQLEKNNLRVFQDEPSIRAGENWLEKIETGLKECSAFIVLVGKKGVTRWVGAEVQIAIARHKAPKDDEDTNKDDADAKRPPVFRLPIFPVLLPDGNPNSLPPFLSTFQIEKWNPEEALPDSFTTAIKNGIELSSKIPLLERCPYLGLSVFQRKDANLFFGRQQETLDALNLFGNPRHSNPEDQTYGKGYNWWLQIEGNSGAGKSSFVNAGLMPIIERGGLWGQTGYEFDIIGRMTPGQNPVEMLAELIARKFKSRLDMDGWIERLQNNKDSFRRLLRERREDNKAFLLIVDQFEELLTITGKKQRTQFDRQLANALTDTKCPFFLITTIRSDFLGDLDKLPGLSIQYNQICGRYRLGTITPDGLKEVIEKPSALAGIDPSEVTAAMLNDSRDEIGVLPLVENALAYLYKHRNGNKLDGNRYHSAGGIAGLLEEEADNMLHRLGKKQRENTLELLLRLTHIGTEGRNTRQRVPLAEALAIAGGGNAEAGQMLLYKLAGLGGGDKQEGRDGLRLIIVAKEEGEYVDLIHETLIRPRRKDENGKIIGYWDTLYQYIDKHRDRDIVRQQLKFRTERWKNSGWLGHWWNLAGFLDARRFRRVRPLKGTSEHNFLRWSQKKNWVNLILASTITAYFTESYIWTIKNELPISSIYLLQKFRLGYKPLPELVSIGANEPFLMGETDIDIINTIDETRQQLNFGYPPKVHDALPPFLIGKFETTFEEFDYFVWHQNHNGNYKIKYPATSKGGRGRQPATSMTWDEANEYAQWFGNMKGNLKCYLPTEAQWEYAARAGTHTGYPWGEEVGKNNANCDGCGSQWDLDSSAPVGQFKPNAFGIYDMNGNVWELTQDSWEMAQDANQPNEILKVVRGGSFYEEPRIIRSTARFNKAASQRFYHTGFRVACE